MKKQMSPIEISFRIMLKKQIQSMQKPQEGKIYALTGATGSKCIANGHTWAESEVK